MTAVQRLAIAAMVTATIATASHGQGLPCGYTLDLVYGPDCGGGNLASVAGSGVSDDGDLCGWFECPGGVEDAFVAWNAGTLTPLSFPAGVNQSRAIDINGNVIVGHYATLNGYRGFRRQGASFTTIEPLPGGNWVEVSRANTAGVIVGAWGSTTTPPLVFPRAYFWSNGGMTDLHLQLVGPLSAATDISESGAITGYMALSASPSNARGFIWQNGIVTDIGRAPGSIGTEPTGINNSNQVCGVAWFSSANSAGFVRRGFLWQNGEYRDLGLIPGYSELFPSSIAHDGTIIGRAAVAPGNTAGPSFVYKAGVLRTVNSLLAGNPGAFVDAARGTNVLRDVADTAGVSGENAGVRLRAIPRMLGDTNCDHVVNVTDLLAVINRWGQSGVHEDVNGDFIVNVTDLLMVISNWG